MSKGDWLCHYSWSCIERAIRRSISRTISGSSASPNWFRLLNELMLFRCGRVSIIRCKRFVAFNAYIP
jgi:hypothetical protein